MKCTKNSQVTRAIVGPARPQKTETITTGKPRVYDCYGILEVAAFIWRALGIFPLTIEGSTVSKKYKLNRFYVFYSCIIFVACNISIFDVLTTWRTEGMDLGFSIVALRSTTSVLYLLVAIIWRIFRHNELSKLIEIVATQESMLKKMNCRVNHESNAKKIRAYVWTTMGIATFLVAYHHVVSGEKLLSRSAVLVKQGMKWIFWCVPVVIQTGDVTMFASLVGLLGLQFRALNERMKTVAIRVNASSPKVILTSDVCAENLLFAAKTHYNICTVGKRINSFFDWTVVINVITAFVILSTTLYNIFVEVQEEDDTNYALVGVYIQWELIHIVPIIELVMVCNWTSNQGIHAEKLIHDIRVVETDSRLYEAVKSFSLQMHHQNLEFTACGFFPLNSTLLQTIVGNITTYLVLLIQFQPKLN